MSAADAIRLSSTEGTPDMDSDLDTLGALIEIHRGLARLGPGDDHFTRQLLSGLPPLPANPRIADLGCGAGAGALLLAQWFGTPVTAVDVTRVFLDELERLARSRGLADLIRTVEADMGALGWRKASLDLLWSEGAAYNLTFAGACRAWRPLLAAGGVAVISELSWFTGDRPPELREFWDAEYPSIGSESENAASAEAAGFDVVGVHRLPSEAWWTSYYDPLEARIASVRAGADAAMSAVIRATEHEIAMFRAFSDRYGYAFYVLAAA